MGEAVFEDRVGIIVFSNSHYIILFSAHTYRSLQSVLSNFELLWEIIITNEVTCISPGLRNIHYLHETLYHVYYTMSHMDK